MSPWLVLLCVLCPLCVLASCRRTPPPPPLPLVPQVSGTIELAGLAAPVQVLRDRSGVPHIYATRVDDLFVAQGFVQAQDRLFQMDLWRRSVQGRLSEVLGPNFVERDGMTRRMQYRGGAAAEWASYGSDTQAIVSAFVRGINAWAALARSRLPEEFVRAGWAPEDWSPADLLNRTDAFIGSGDALDEIRTKQMSGAIAESIRRVGTAPFFAGGLSDRPPDSMLRPSASGTARAGRGGVLAATEVRRRYEHPSARYLVHLHAPGWNVIGATSPWLPGVAIGHNERIAWGMTPLAADTQDVYALSIDSPRTTIKEPIIVKGRPEPFIDVCEHTARGVVVATDRERRLAYTVQWSGFEPGAAAELAALAIDRAGTWTEFRSALERWKMPARRVTYADVDGNVGYQDAALVPVRRSGEWRRWMTIDELPHALNPRGGSVTATEPPRELATVEGEAVFAHVLGVGRAAQQRFNVGPLDRPRSDDSPVRVVFTPADWDRSRAMNAPGQSGSPASPHFADLARLWSTGASVPLLFSDGVVRAAAASTLLLVPPSTTGVRR